VRRIEQLFNDGFKTIQESVRDIDRVLRQLSVTLLNMLTSLEISDWVTLREQDARMRDEIVQVNNEYDGAQADLDVTLLDLDTNLNAALEGQVLLHLQYF
jgi:hypothetical protein